MMRLHGRMRATALTLGAIALASTAVAAVIPRDMTKQLELIDAANAGIVVYGTIDASRAAEIDGTNVPWNVLTVKVSQVLAGENVPAEVTVYVPGFGDHLLSISPPESETRVGEKVVMFLAANADIRAVDADAFKVDSFAEIYRTQANRQGDVVVLGEGASFAIPNNAKLADVATSVK